MAGPANTGIVALIRDADRGRLVPDMQAGVDEIIAAIEAARGAGTGELTLKLKIKSTSEGVYELIPDLKVKVPEAKRMPMVAFYDEDGGGLQRRDPRQPDLPGFTTIEGRQSGQSDQ